MCRNHKHFHTPITDKQRAKSKVNSHSQLHKENKIPRNTATKGSKRPLQGELPTTAQGTERTQTDGETFHAYGQQESISCKWPYCPK